MYPADTNYAQETVESPLWHLAGALEESYWLVYTVFGDVYVGLNDFIELSPCDTVAPNSMKINGPFPGPGDFDN
jgi:hypothetical protein